MNKFTTIGLLTLVAACAEITPAETADDPSTLNYTDPSQSGLQFSDPYPNANDVCVKLNESSFIEPFMLEGHFLIACPKHERGALSDRMDEGAEVVANARHWVVLRLAE